MKNILFLFLWQNVYGFKECSSGSDTAKPTAEFLVSPFFPHRTPRALKCKFSLSVNYGDYIKLIPDVIEIPCAGGNGVYVEEEGGRAGPFCGQKKMPAFISRDVKFDIHIVIDTPLRGARVKIGYKSVTNPKGTNLPKVRKNAAKPPVLLKMAPDQGQGQLQQQNLQNFENEQQQQQQQVSDQGQGPAVDPWAKPAGGRQSYKPKKKEWVSETYNPIPVSNYPYDDREAEEEGIGMQLVLPLIFLVILIGVLILVVHKRRQKMKADLKKLEETGNSKDTMKKDFIPFEKAPVEKTEPTMAQINQVIEASNNAASLEDKANEALIPESNAKVVTAAAPVNKVSSTMAAEKVHSPPAPANTLVANTALNQVLVPHKAQPKIAEKTVSTDSGLSKDSQATTAPSIKSEMKSECPKPPDRPNRNPVVRPMGRRQQQQIQNDDDRPSY